MASEQLTRVLDEAGVSYERLPHAHTESALAEAGALGVDPNEVGKTLVVSTPVGYVRTIVPAARRLDERKVAEVVGAGRKKVHLATEDALRRDSEFELGAVPPVGGSRREPVIVDERLAGRDSVVVEAGSHDESCRLSTQDLIRLTAAQVADICEEPTE